MKSFGRAVSVVCLYLVIAVILFAIADPFIQQVSKNMSHVLCGILGGLSAWITKIIFTRFYRDAK